MNISEITERDLSNRRKGKKTKTEKGEDEKKRQGMDADPAYAQFSAETKDVLCAMDENKIDLAVIETLIWHLCSSGTRDEGTDTGRSNWGVGGAILVFFPGMADIIGLQQRLKASASRYALFSFFCKLSTLMSLLLFRYGGQQKIRILPLHSSVSTEEQQQVFDKAPPGVQKIILATKYALTVV